MMSPFIQIIQRVLARLDHHFPCFQSFFIEFLVRVQFEPDFEEEGILLISIVCFPDWAFLRYYVMPGGQASKRNLMHNWYLIESLHFLSVEQKLIAELALRNSMVALNLKLALLKPWITPVDDISSGHTFNRIYIAHLLHQLCYVQNVIADLVFIADEDVDRLIQAFTWTPHSPNHTHWIIRNFIGKSSFQRRRSHFAEIKDN